MQRTNTIGGTAAGAGNVISGNARAGVFIYDSATGNLVAGNYIGTDVTGTMPLGNAYVRRGDRRCACEQHDRRDDGRGRNVISGNVQGGVLIDDSATGNLVAGNFIGTDVTGTKALGNAYTGVEIADSAWNNTIGGTTAGDRNVISGNAQAGVFIDGSATGNLVAGNFIGTDVTGTKALGNGTAGVEIADSAWNNTIGGTTAGDRNVISGNAKDGVFDPRQRHGQPGRGQLHRHRPHRYEGPGKRGLRRPDRRRRDEQYDRRDGSRRWQRDLGQRRLRRPHHGGRHDGQPGAGNTIGTDITGTVALGNTQGGVQVDDGAANNTIGGLTTSDGVFHGFDFASGNIVGRLDPAG